MDPNSLLRRDGSIAFFASLLLAAIAVLVTLFLWEPIYRAEVMLEASTSWLPTEPPPPIDLAGNEASLVTDTKVLRHVLSNPRIRQWASTQSNLREHLSVRPTDTDSRMVIAYDDKDSAMAAEICSAITEAYLQARSTTQESHTNHLDPDLNRYTQGQRVHDFKAVESTYSVNVLNSKSPTEPIRSLPTEEMIRNGFFALLTSSVFFLTVIAVRAQLHKSFSDLTDS
ncbi:MAG: hypothetical protein AAGG48_03170 [Planctomycetota bacterium]